MALCITAREFDGVLIRVRTAEREQDFAQGFSGVTSATALPASARIFVVMPGAA
jgi:hypothetical protein